MSGTLVLVRHGQSEWNLKNLFTGWRDVGLSEQGVREAKTAGEKLAERGMKFDIAYTSALSRAQVTCQLILEAVGQRGLKTIKDQALNERDYGDLVGLNKDDARKRWGEEQVHKWRRSYDIAPPGGESLKDTVARALPYFVQEILPRVLRGERTIVAAHGNSLRAVMKHLEGISDDDIAEVNLPTGSPRGYRLDATCTKAEEARYLGDAAAIAAKAKAVAEQTKAR